jgi:hypothetical protein
MPPSATRNYLQDKGYNAAAALTKYRAVKFSAAETVTPTTAVGDLIAGVVQHDVSAAEITRGKGASIAVEGATLWEASEAIPVGSNISIVADGRCAVAAATEMTHGICVEPTLAAGEYARVQLAINNRIA